MGSDALLEVRGNSIGSPSQWLLALALAGAALGVGAVHAITLCVVTCILLISLLAGWWNAKPLRARAAATTLLAVGCLLLLYTAVQCIPVPIRWLATVAPHNADIWSNALSPLPTAPPDWVPLTLDPSATYVEVMKGTAYIIAFVAALRTAGGRTGIAFLCWTLITIAIVLALAALIHPAFGAHKLFGVYAPGPGISERHLAPLLNPNHLAGYLNIGLCLAFAMTLTEAAPIRRIIPAAATLFLVATQVWIGSRGGTICMVLGIVLILSILRAHAGTDPASARLGTVLMMGAAIAGTVMIVLGSADQAVDDLFGTDISKFQVLSNVWRMLRDYGWLGIGRGAFESTFPQYRTGAGYLNVTHPENLPAQWCTEWGLPVTLFAGSAIAYALRPQSALSRSRVVGGAWAAVICTFVQNLADFSTEIPGVMLSVVVCGALVVGGTSGRRATRAISAWGQSPRIVCLIGTGAAIVTLGFVASVLGRSVGDDRQTLYEAAVVEHAPVGRIHEIVRAAMLRHPAEPYLPFVVGVRAAELKDENPLPWLGATLARAKVYGPAHLALARVLRKPSPSQGRLEYRLAVEQAPELLDVVLAEVPSLVDGFDSALEVVPHDKSAEPVLEGLAATVGDRLPATRARLDVLAASRFPTATGPRDRAAEDAVLDLEAADSAPWCDGTSRPRCLEKALTLSQLVQQAETTRCNGFALEARARAASGEPARAMADLERATDLVVDRVPCLRELVSIATRATDDAQVDRALAAIVASGGSTDAEYFANLVYVANVQLRRRNLTGALAAYMRAYDRAPASDWVLGQIGTVASQLGLYGQAEQAYRELARRHPEEPQWRASVQVQHEALSKSLLQLR